MSDLQKKQLRAVAEHQSKAAKTMDSVEQMQSAIPRMAESQKQLQERVEVNPIPLLDSLPLHARALEPGASRWSLVPAGY